MLIPLGERWVLPERVPRDRRALVTGWLDLLATWNARIDLTAARSAEELVDLMLEDALVLSLRIPSGASVVDIGSGAGAPGLALALLRPDVRMHLVEPLNKRVAFMRTVIGTVRAENVVLERGRGEELLKRPERFDVAISRATLAPPAWLALGAELVREGGSVWVLLAKEAPPEHASLRAQEDVSYAWELTGAERRAVRYA